MANEPTDAELFDQPDTIVSWGTPPDNCAATRRAIVRAAAAVAGGTCPSNTSEGNRDDK